MKWNSLEFILENGNPQLTNILVIGEENRGIMIDTSIFHLSNSVAEEDTEGFWRKSLRKKPRVLA